jgi:hypothetical protein
MDLSINSSGVDGFECDSSGNQLTCFWLTRVSDAKETKLDNALFGRSRGFTGAFLRFLDEICQVNDCGFSKHFVPHWQLENPLDHVHNNAGGYYM